MQDVPPLSSFANRQSYASGAVKEPLLGLTYGQLVDIQAERLGDRVFITDRPAGKSVTFRGFKERVDLVGKSLIALGVKKGDRVAMLGMNSADWVLMQFAAPTIGAIFCNLNAAFPQEQLARMIAHCDPAVIFSQQSYSRSAYFDMLRAIHTDPTHSARSRTLVAMEGEGSADGLLAWDDFIALGTKTDSATLEQRKAEVDPDDVNIMCYTGGTSGVLKGALRTHNSVVNAPRRTTLIAGLNETSVVCTSFLYFHTAGMNGGTTLAMVSGARLVVASKSFDADAVLAAFYEEGVTHYSGVPTMLKILLDHPAFDGSKLKLRTVTTGAAGCPPELMLRTRREMGVDLCVAYGGTEPGTLCMTGPGDPEEKQISTVGRMAQYVELKIIEPETGQIVPRGMSGEVCSRSISGLRGYYNAPELTASVLDAHGWYHSGDLGVMDDEGYLRIIGRIDDMIIRGGENIQPIDVENLLKTWPGVHDVNVVAVPDITYGQEVCAWMIMDGPLDEPALRAFCKQKLAYYQVPRFIFAIDAFPQTGVGKVDRNALRRLAEDRAKAMPG